MKTKLQVLNQEIDNCIRNPNTIEFDKLKETLWRLI